MVADVWECVFWSCFTREAGVAWLEPWRIDRLRSQLVVSRLVFEQGREARGKIESVCQIEVKVVTVPLSR